MEWRLTTKTEETKEMKARKFSITMTGQSPLLLHHDNLKWAESMAQWTKDPASRGVSVPGDDRTPAWRWIGNLYVEANAVVIPSDNLMTVLREGGKQCPTGKRQATFKAKTQSGIMVDQSSWPITINGSSLPYEPLKKLIGNPNFDQHEEQVASLGFSLFVKRARIGTQKHVRVRPRFDTWSCAGTVTVFEETITKEVLQNIMAFAGAYSGIGDWRPSSPKSPGPFGKFTAEVKEA